MKSRIFASVVVLTSLLAGECALAATPAAKPAAKPTAAAGKVCKLNIAGNDAMQFDKKELRVAAGCVTVQLIIKHSGRLPISAMGHNVVITKTADAMPVNNAGMTAGIKNNHVPPDDKRVIAFTAQVGAGQSATVSFARSLLQKGGDYTYFCSFPGHIGLMRGKLIVD